jgi:hypothetical protein
MCERRVVVSSEEWNRANCTPKQRHVLACGRESNSAMGDRQGVIHALFMKVVQKQ